MRLLTLNGVLENADSSVDGRRVRRRTRSSAVAGWRRVKTMELSRENWSLTKSSRRLFARMEQSRRKNSRDATRCRVIMPSSCPFTFIDNGI